MAQFDIQQFLNNGAFIRLKSGKVRAWSGPFTVSEAHLHKNDSGKSQDSFVNTILYKNFFDSEVYSLQSQGSVLETDASTFRQLLQAELRVFGSVPGFGGFLPPSQEAFFTSFQTIMGKIQRGEIEKAVPIVFTESPIVPSTGQLAQMIDRSLDASEELFPFGVWFNGSGILGATPEVLFRNEGTTLFSMALAGTAPAEQIQNLKSDRKEIFEHQVVVEDIENRLKSFGWVRKEATKAIKIGAVAHLRTELSVAANRIDLQKLLQILHPTAALGVYPKNYGIQWMKELPYQSQRGLFGAPILFPISKLENICLVAIRSLQWSPDGSRVGTGCGIVRDSQQDREWQELGLKRRSTFKVLGIES